MRALLPLFLFLSTTGYAADEAVVQLDMELSIDGRLVFQPKVVSVPGETVTVESVSAEGDGYLVEVRPIVHGENQVRMNFVIATLDNGKRTILSEPTIVSPIGESAEIVSVLKDRPHDSVSLAVKTAMKAKSPASNPSQ